MDALGALKFAFTIGASLTFPLALKYILFYFKKNISDPLYFPFAITLSTLIALHISEKLSRTLAIALGIIE